MSRSSLAVVEIQRLWLLPLLQLATLGVFLAQGYLSVVHVSWPMALLVLWEGLLGGATCASCRSAMTDCGSPLTLYPSAPQT